MPQQRRVAHHVEVRVVRRDQVPVHVVEERAGDVAAGVGEVLAREDRGQDQRREHDDDEGGEEASGTTHPEAEQIDPVPGLPLDEQQRRDQVAAEDEKEVDAEEAARQPVDARVVEEDGHHRERAQAVQPGPVLDVRCVGDWLRHFRRQLRVSCGGPPGRFRRSPQGTSPARRARVRDRSARRAKLRRSGFP